MAFYYKSGMQSENLKKCSRKRRKIAPSLHAAAVSNSDMQNSQKTLPSFSSVLFMMYILNGKLS